MFGTASKLHMETEFVTINWSVWNQIVYYPHHHHNHHPNKANGATQLYNAHLTTQLHTQRRHEIFTLVPKQISVLESIRYSASRAELSGRVCYTICCFYRGRITKCGEKPLRINMIPLALSAIITKWFTHSSRAHHTLAVAVRSKIWYVWAG